MSTSFRIAAALVGAAILGALLATPSFAQPSSDRDAIRRAVLDYVEGFYTGDSTLLVRSVRPEVYKYGFYRAPDSTGYRGMQMTWPAFHAFANRVKASGRPAAADSPREIVLLDVLDQTASAKLTAYWGTDYLLLARFDGKWMITHVLWQSLPRTAAAR